MTIIQCINTSMCIGFFEKAGTRLVKLGRRRLRLMFEMVGVMGRMSQLEDHGCCSAVRLSELTSVLYLFLLSTAAVRIPQMMEEAKEVKPVPVA